MGGGSYQHAQSTALFQPAAEAMGITVNEETYGGMSDVKLKVNSGAAVMGYCRQWFRWLRAAAAEGILEELDYSVIDVSDFYPGLVHGPTALEEMSSPQSWPTTLRHLAITDRRIGLISGMLRNFRANAPIAPKSMVPLNPRSWRTVFRLIKSMKF